MYIYSYRIFIGRRIHPLAKRSNVRHRYESSSTSFNKKVLILFILLNNKNDI